MPLSTLDPKTALIVIDLQKGVVTIPVAHPIDGIVQRSASLAAAFREQGMPVVGRAPGRTEASRPAGATPPADWVELVTELDAQPDDLRVTKQTWGAFHGTDLDAQLQHLGVTRVERIFPRLGETATTAEILERLR